MTYPKVRFVSAPDPDATVLFDCNADMEPAPRSVLADGFSLGAPTLQGDPRAMGVVYGDRELSFTLRVEGSKGDALACLSALARQLLRASSWVEFTLAAGQAPVWFRTYRSQPQALSLAEVYVDTKDGGVARLPDRWDIPVTLAAEGLGYGERVLLGPYTIAQAPTGSHPLGVTLPTLRGDAPTGLRVQITPDATLTSGNDCEWTVACISGETTMSDPVVDIGTDDGFTAGTGTDTGVADPDFFGGSYRTVTIGAGSGFVTRLSGSLPITRPGRYKVLVRCEAENYPVESRRYLFRLERPVGGYTIAGATATVDIDAGTPVPAGFEGFQGWVDLGDFALPAGHTVPDDVAVTSPGCEFELKIGTDDDSAGEVRIDAFKLIPIQGPDVGDATYVTVLAAGSHALNGGKVCTLDSDSDLVWTTDTSGVLYERSPSLAGGYPVADPAAEQNLLLVFASSRGNYIGSGPWITALDAEATLTVSYHPRLLHLGDGT